MEIRHVTQFVAYYWGTCCCRPTTLKMQIIIAMCCMHLLNSKCFHSNKLVKQQAFMFCLLNSKHNGLFNLLPSPPVHQSPLPVGMDRTDVQVCFQNHYFCIHRMVNHALGEVLNRTLPAGLPAMTPFLFTS